MAKKLRKICAQPEEELAFAGSGAGGAPFMFGLKCWSGGRTLCPTGFPQELQSARLAISTDGTA
jgi:hypothetical protein